MVGTESLGFREILAAAVDKRMGLRACLLTSRFYLEPGQRVQPPDDDSNASANPG
jgi:hypothetical protein